MRSFTEQCVTGWNISLSRRQKAQKKVKQDPELRNGVFFSWENNR